MGKSRTILALNGIVMMLIGICFFLIFLTTLFIKYKFMSVDIPIVGIAIFPILSLLSLYVSTRPYQE